MTGTITWKLSRFAAALAVIASFAAAAQTVTSLPAGLACDFQLTITEYEGHQHTIVRDGKKGSIFLKAGASGDVQFTNQGTGATYILKGKGGSFATVVNAVGETTLTFTGHYVLVWFPADQPSGAGSAGPATTLYLGRVTVKVNPDGTWTYLASAGKQTDICALLS